MKEKVDIVIDSNEEAQAPELVEILVLHEDVSDFKIEELETGDIIVENCVFERKTPSDFASSLQEGRLREQVERMAGMGEGGMNPFVLIEGDMGDFESLSHTDIPPKSLRGMVASVIARNNIHVVFCSDQKNLADMAIRIGRKSIEDADSVQVSKTDTIYEPTFAENVFLGVEGVGIGTAKEIAQEYSSVREIATITEEDLLDIDGIGEKRAKKITEEIHAGGDSTESENKKGGPRTITV